MQYGKKDSPPPCLLPLSDKILTLVIYDTGVFQSRETGNGYQAAGRGDLIQRL